MVEFQTDMQRRVYKVLSEPFDTDVKIDELFMCAYPGQPLERMAMDSRGLPMALPTLTNRDMQQYLAPLFARMNTRLAVDGMKIEPGQLKQTYRLSTIQG